MNDDRRKQAEHWAAEQLGWRDYVSESVSSDASFRRYFRLRAMDRSVIVMDAPPELEPVSAFLDVAGRLGELVNVPDILAADVGHGFVLLQDLGSRPYHRELDADNADALFGDALTALLDIQRKADCTGLPDYDPSRLYAELALFIDWFLEKHWQVEPSESELDAWDQVCALLVRWAIDQPQLFCHRDYMPRNLMLTEPNPGIIDFQDAVRGPISYDPICLFRDAFLSWPPGRVDAWLEGYRQQALAAGLPITTSADLWRKTCDLMGVQRHLKVIGIFARIRYRDGKPAYLEDHPRFFGYLKEAMGRNPELALLDELLTAWRSRARPVNRDY
ncbi:MAG: phosphotransferase [Wenzhouxiangella sp.]|nr:phosphotransferase [Wenzhouxiangella sp.]MCH8478037.1 phosphotransferase [Wenzhouxiangella sp.]TVR93801.1 MAG: aminoglycoside phosphotransferase [Wenzhouxiangellaceae bacterium]